MNRGEIVSRVQSRVNDTSSATLTLIREFIDEVIREIESIHPYPWNRARSTAGTTPGINSLTLPADLISHHDFLVTLIEQQSPEQRKVLTSLDWVRFKELIDTPDDQGPPDYYIHLAQMADNNLKVGLYPVPNQVWDIEFYGHHYTDTSGWTDASQNWLTVNKPDVVIYGVAAKIFNHLGQSENANTEYSLFNQYLYGTGANGPVGLITQAKRQRSGNQYPRVRLVYDDARGNMKHRYGY